MPGQISRRRMLTDSGAAALAIAAYDLLGRRIVSAAPITTHLFTQPGHLTHLEGFAQVREQLLQAGIDQLRASISF